MPSYVKNPTVVGEAEARVMEIDQLEATGLQTLKECTAAAFNKLCK